MVDLFNNFTIGKKLNLYILLPLLTILLFASNIIFEKHQHLRHTQNTLHYSHIVSQLSELIYQLQKERGLSAGVVNSQGEIFAKELVKQRQKTNLAMQFLIQNSNEKPGYLTTEIISKFNHLNMSLKNLASIRTKVDFFVSDTFFDFYSDIIAESLSLISILPTLNAIPELNKTAISYIDLLWLEEHAGQERGALNGLFSSQRFNYIKLNEISSYVLAQQSAIRRFYNIASVEHQQLLTQAFSHSSTDKVKFAREQAKNKTLKQEMLSSFQNLIVNVGLIHNIKKNPAIHSDSLLAENAQATLHQINNYLQLPNLTTNEETALYTIATALEHYKNDNTSNSRWIVPSPVDNQIDQAISITDKSVLTAYTSLQNNMSAYEFADWWNNATQRLDLIHDVSSLLVKKISFHSLQLNSQTQHLLNTYLIAIVSILLVVSFLGIKLRSRLVHEIKSIARTMREYSNNHAIEQKLTIKGSDELADMVNAFNNLITQRNQHEQQLRQVAHYDVLTGLPNRALLADRFSQAVAHCNRTNSQLAICVLDLDNFKHFNDRFGHKIGDQLLIEVSDRVSANIRDEDTVSRQSGDEFAILLGNIESYSQCEHTLNRILQSLIQPFPIEQTSYKLTASIGVTLYPQDDVDIDSLLRHADNAMYQAKLLGRNRYQLFNTEKDQETIIKHQQLNEIRQALINNEFCLYFQPKVNMITGEVFGAEALIRWNHPKKGLVPPLNFLPIIEATELEIQVGNWVITQALMQLDKWLEQGIILEVSVNISSHHLLSDNFIHQLDSALAQHPSVNSQSFQLEILESSTLGDLNHVSNIIKNCQKQLGVNIALDDFGTGYSSLTHIRNLSINTIKIDQSFVRNMLDNPDDYAIVEGVMGLSNIFNRNAIAEGVETIEQGLILMVMGCNEAQGYIIAKPMPAQEITDWLVYYTPNKDWSRYSNKYLSPKKIK